MRPKTGHSCLRVLYNSSRRLQELYARRCRARVAFGAIEQSCPQVKLKFAAMPAATIIMENLRKGAVSKPGWSVALRERAPPRKGAVA
jgi:hypothetical protein